MKPESESHLGKQREAQSSWLKPEIIKAWAKRLAPAVLLLLLRRESAMTVPPPFYQPVEEPKKVCPSERYEIGVSPWGEESKSDEYGCLVEVIKEDDGRYHVYVGPPIEDSG